MFFSVFSRFFGQSFDLRGKPYKISMSIIIHCIRYTKYEFISKVCTKATQIWHFFFSLSCKRNNFNLPTTLSVLRCILFGSHFTLDEMRLKLLLQGKHSRFRYFFNSPKLHFKQICSCITSSCCYLFDPLTTIMQMNTTSLKFI